MLQNEQTQNNSSIKINDNENKMAPAKLDKVLGDGFAPGPKPAISRINEFFETLNISFPRYFAVVDNYGRITRHVYSSDAAAALGELEPGKKAHKLLVQLNPINKLMFEQYISQGLLAQDSEDYCSLPSFLIDKITNIAIYLKFNDKDLNNTNKNQDGILKLIEELKSDFGFPNPCLIKYANGCKFIFNTNLPANETSRQHLQEFVKLFKDRFRLYNFKFFEDFDAFTQLIELPLLDLVSCDNSSANEKNFTLQKSNDESLLTLEKLQEFILHVKRLANANLQAYQKSSEDSFDACVWFSNRLRALTTYINAADGRVYADIVDSQTNQLNPTPMDDPKFLKSLALELAGKHSCKLKRKEKQTIESAIDQEIAHTLYYGNQECIHSRIAHKGDTIFYDLCNQEGLIYSISPKGLQILHKNTPNTSHLHFKVTPNMNPQVIPLNNVNKSLTDLLNPFLNMDDNSKILLTITLVCWFVKGFNYFLWLKGQQGSGKTMLSKMLQNLLDPTSANPGPLPNSTRELATVLSSRYLVVFDNMSKINEGVSDLLCQSTYGATFQTRKLFTNSGTVSIPFHNAIILNSIADDIVKKVDLYQRIIPIKMKALDKNRKSETLIMKQFEEVRPSIIFKVFDTISKALAVLPSIEIPSTFRLIDSARLGAAVSKVLYGDEKIFINAFENIEKESALAILENDPVMNSVLGWLREQEELQSVTQGCSRPLTLEPISSVDFYQNILNFADKSKTVITLKGMAPDAPALTKKIKQYKANFRTLGVEFETTHTNKCNIWQISLNKPLTKNNSKAA